MKFDSTQDNLMNKHFISPKELSLYFGVSLKTIYRRIDNREIRFHKIGKSIRFRKVDIEVYINNSLVESISK